MNSQVLFGVLWLGVTPWPLMWAFNHVPEGNYQLAAGVSCAIIWIVGVVITCEAKQP